MTVAKVAITLAPEHLERARAAVREGRAASVSGYIARAIERQTQEESLAALVHDLATAAHVSIYEHDLLPTPLRVLATTALRDGRAYAVSCSAPPEAFAANEAVFRQITQSFRWKP